MSGHHKFSQLTNRFSEERKAIITQKTDQIKQKIESSQLKQTNLCDDLTIQEKTDLKLKH